MPTPEVQFRSDTLIEVGFTVGEAFVAHARAERGPLLRTAMATEALFNGVPASEGVEAKTAEQVQIETLGHPLHGKYRVNDPLGRDRNGALIQYGQEFAYLDWQAPHVWHIYEFCTEAWTGPNTVVLDGNGDPVPHSDPELAAQGCVQTELGPAWRRRGYKTTQAEAVADATVLAQAHGA